MFHRRYQSNERSKFKKEKKNNKKNKKKKKNPPFIYSVTDVVFDVSC